MKIGQIVELDEYTEAAEWCVANNATLKVVEPVTREVEEIYTENVEIKEKFAAQTHEEIIPAEYDEDGNEIKPEETKVIVDEPEHEETREETVEKTRMVEKVFRRYQIVEIPEQTEEEKAQIELATLHRYLENTDWVSAKLAEVVDDEETYAEMKAKYADILQKRKEARARINELES